MVAVGIPVAAMIILLGVFSGFEEIIRGLYRGFDPDLLVRPVEGKVFSVSDLDVEAVAGLSGVEAAEFVLEESALLDYRGRQVAATVRGQGGGGVVVGQGIAYELAIRQGFSEPLRFWVPRRGGYSALIPMSAFSTASAPIEGVFEMDSSTDGEYVLTGIEFARQLFDYPGQASALAVRTHGGSGRKLAAQVGQIVGPGFEVLTREQQRADMYRILRVEKWGVFFVGVMVLVVASLSIVGSLVMLVIDKRDSTRTLEAMGVTRRGVQKIFITQGMMIACIGAAGGLLLGVLVCGAQQLFGFVPMPGGTFLIDEYPVRLRAVDVAAVCAAFLCVTGIITTFTVRTTLK